MLARSDSPYTTVAPPPSAPEARAGGKKGASVPALAPDAPGEGKSAPETLAWTAHPAKDQPGRTALVLLAISVTWWIALAAFHSPFMGIVSSLAILGSVAEALFPIHHRMTSEGISTRCAWQMRTMAWDAVRSARAGTEGIHLSPLKTASRRSHIRGVTLRFAGGNDPAVTALVRRYLDEEREKQDAAMGRRGDAAKGKKAKTGKAKTGKAKTGKAKR